MICIHCGVDSKYRERVGGRCQSCFKPFAFEPKGGDPFTDAAFKAAIDAVSANGQVRWGVEHLYYELCRRLWRRMWFGFLVRRFARPIVRMDQSDFDALWSRWLSTHGEPKGLIVRKTPKAAPKSRRKERDIGDYSFDRAVICDRARTVDLLIANNFHFENNCAVLSIGGYPEGPFETVRTMLKRNPKLRVFAIHDATVPGCRLAHTLASDPAWFKGQVPVTDVGLRPGQSGPFKGLFLPASGLHVAAGGEGLRAAEAEWLSSYVLELAAIRPEQILKRLFKAINRKEEKDIDADYGDSSSGGGNGDSNVNSDDDAFSSDAGAAEGGGDSFG